MMMNIIIMNFGGGGGCEWCASRYRLGLPGRCYRGDIGASRKGASTIDKNILQLFQQTLQRSERPIQPNS